MPCWYTHPPDICLGTAFAGLFLICNGSSLEAGFLSRGSRRVCTVNDHQLLSSRYDTIVALDEDVRRRIVEIGIEENPKDSYWYVLPEFASLSFTSSRGSTLSCSVHSWPCAFGLPCSRNSC